MPDGNLTVAAEKLAIRPVTRHQPCSVNYKFLKELPNA